MFPNSVVKHHFSYTTSDYNIAIYILHADVATVHCKGANDNITFSSPLDAGVEVNDTVVGDPLLNIPVLVPESDLAQLGGSQRVSLCYEIHGRPDTHFNFVTDDCASINAHYIKLTSYLNVIDRVGIRAVELGAQPQCRNISVDLSGCSAMIDGMPLNQSGRYNFRGIRVRQYSERVRIAVPNCNDLSLVVWVICQRRTLSDPFNGEKITANMIKIAVMRGLNFGHRNAHGLLGKYKMCLIFVLDSSFIPMPLIGKAAWE